MEAPSSARPRRRRLRNLMVCGAGAVLAAALAACGTSAGGSGGGSAGAALPSNLSVMVQGQQPTFDQWNGGVATYGSILLVNEPLIRFDGSRFQPNLAVSFSQPSATQYVYTLRPGVKFTDGHPVTPEDVKYSLLTAAENTHASTTWVYMSSIKDIEIDGQKITVNLKAPQPQFQYVVAVTGVVEQSFYQKYGDTVGTPGVGQIGSGPYMLKSFTPEKFTIEKNPHYWGTPGKFDTITFSIPKDDSSRLLSLESGDSNAIFEIPIAQVNAIKALPGFTVEQIPDQTLYILQFDVTKKPFNDPKVRAAVRHAIDREGIVQAVFGGYGTVAPTLTTEAALDRVAGKSAVSSALAGFAADNKYDVSEAKQLIAQSSAAAGLSITIPVETDDQNVSLIGQSIAADLAQIGIKATIKPEGEEYFTDVMQKKQEDGITLSSFSTLTPDAAMPMSYFTPVDGVFNLTQYDNTVATKDYDDSNALAVGDPERGQLILDALKSMQDSGTILPLAFPDMFFGLHSMDEKGFTNYWWMQRWDLEVSAK